MMNQTGSGFGAGFFYVGKGAEHKKKPRFYGKIRACQKLLQNYDFSTFRNGKLIYQMVINRITILC